MIQKLPGQPSADFDLRQRLERNDKRSRREQLAGDYLTEKRVNKSIGWSDKVLLCVKCFGLAMVAIAIVVAVTMWLALKL